MVFFFFFPHYCLVTNYCGLRADKKKQQPQTMLLYGVRSIDLEGKKKNRKTRANRHT